MIMVAFVTLSNLALLEYLVAFVGTCLPSTCQDDIMMQPFQRNLSVPVNTVTQDAPCYHSWNK